MPGGDRLGSPGSGVLPAPTPDAASAAAGLRYYLDSPASGPNGLAFRAVFTLLFPR
jgi:hypothetical protein